MKAKQSILSILLDCIERGINYFLFILRLQLQGDICSIGANLFLYILQRVRDCLNYLPLDTADNSPIDTSNILLQRSLPKKMA